LTVLFNVRGYFLAGKSYKQFPRSGDADSVKADKRFEVMFFRGEPLLFVCFVFAQKAFLICSLVSCFQIYLSAIFLLSCLFLVLIFTAISKYITSGFSSLGFMFRVKNQFHLRKEDEGKKCKRKGEKDDEKKEKSHGCLDETEQSPQCMGKGLMTYTGFESVFKFKKYWSQFIN